MTDNFTDINHRLINLTRLCTEYCGLCQQAAEIEKEELIDSFLSLLPRIYWEFFDISTDDLVTLTEPGYQPNYLDEEYYENIRRNLETSFGADDTFLETFEEDMKYSETPIAASISESLADIFQPLFNFISVVKDTEGEGMKDAYILCKETFIEYWSQTLCNVLRALNHIKYQ